jgi:signal transduction histidine kinase
MNVKTKLQITYLIMFLSTLFLGGIAIWAIENWNATANELTHAYNQDLRAEKLRGNIYRQIKETVFAFMDGEDYKTLEGEFTQSEKEIKRQFEEINQNIKSQKEQEHVQALQRTHQQIADWIHNLLVQLSNTDDVSVWSFEYRLEKLTFKEQEQLIEILKKYYENEADRLVKHTTSVKSLAKALIILVFGLVVAQLLVFILSTHRWLVTPLAKISRSTKIMSTGNLDHRIDIQSKNEFGRLAQSINKMARSLSEIQNRLIQSERLAAVGELTSYVAHNIRNPLAGIRYAAQVSLDDLEERDYKGIKEALEDIITAADKLGNWVQHLLSYIRPLKLNLIKGDVQQIIQNSVSMLKPKILSQNLTLELDLQPSVIETLVDAMYLEQVIHTLVLNAIEASSSKGVIALKSQILRESQEEERIGIRIKDEGKGMPPEVLAKVGTPYFTTKSYGTGLGLAMAHKIISYHQGTLTFSSEQGRGTVIEITLPIIH